MRGRDEQLVRKLGDNFDLTRSPAIQAQLLKEHLEWLNTNLSDLEEDTIVYLALWVATEKAKVELEDSSLDMKYLAKVFVFLEKADIALKDWGLKCLEIKEEALSRLRVPN